MSTPFFELAASFRVCVSSKSRRIRQSFFKASRTAEDAGLLPLSFQAGYRRYRELLRWRRKPSGQSSHSLMRSGTQLAKRHTTMHRSHSWSLEASKSSSANMASIRNAIAHLRYSDAIRPVPRSSRSMNSLNELSSSSINMKPNPAFEATCTKSGAGASTPR